VEAVDGRQSFLFSVMETGFGLKKQKFRAGVVFLSV